MKPKLTLLAAALALSAATLHAADWPQYRGPSHDGKSPESVAKWSAQGPRAVWRTPTPNGFSSFTVADGRAYTLLTREAEGAARETLVALDAKTGKELWAVPFGSASYGHGGVGSPGTELEFAL